MVWRPLRGLRVLPDIASHAVVTGTTEDDVGLQTTPELIVAIAAIDTVTIPFAVDHIVVGIAVDVISTVTTLDGVRAVVAEDRVIARVAVDVVAGRE
jgi:hypothetical protein